MRRRGPFEAPSSVTQARLLKKLHERQKQEDWVWVDSSRHDSLASTEKERRRSSKEIVKCAVADSHFHTSAHPTLLSFLLDPKVEVYVGRRQ